MKNRKKITDDIYISINCDEADVYFLSLELLTKNNDFPKLEKRKKYTSLLLFSVLYTLHIKKKNTE